MQQPHYLKKTTPGVSRRNSTRWSGCCSSEAKAPKAQTPANPTTPSLLYADSRILPTYLARSRPLDLPFAIVWPRTDGPR
ncbi:Hypothetical protein PMT_2648 [Prochlorococcus marinus str. MIT 9313]|uniref:Uncharacterized protein n=1 Tax=Prochlorococcus marinus (strain MIT 9313) TaxID=74547 RepID=B9ES34_PROMM|nr:Hypothetical protein PMT_2648 [Prochlorococcus marinus str. MIT 9313]